MTREEVDVWIFDFLKDHLKVHVIDASESSMCGGEMPGHLGVRIKLLLKNPLTGEMEEIYQDSCYFT